MLAKNDKINSNGGNVMKFYNTLTRQIEEFIPNKEGEVIFYTCGPTAYHDQHIGNMRNYIGHDVLDKTL